MSNKRILIHRLILVAAGATSLTFKTGTTARSGAMAMSANGALLFDLSGEPWFTTATSEAFNVSSSNAVQVGGTLYYDTR